MSNEICSTATSGVYSVTESDCSNCTEQTSTNNKLGLQEGERK